MNKKLIKDYAKKLGREKGVKVSAEEAENEIIRIMQKVSRNLAPIFRFGYHSVEDVEQQGILYALKALSVKNIKYDINRPLENYLYTHVHNRLHNYKRKHYARIEPACTCCDPANPPAYPCQKFTDWQKRNTNKQNIMCTLDISNVSDELENTMRTKSEIFDQSIVSELKNLIDRELPVDLRKDYLQLIEGKKISKSQREKVREAVLVITKEKGYIDATEEDES